MDTTFNHPSMQQHGNASNNVQIGSAGNGNTFHISQSQDSSRDNPIHFGRDHHLYGQEYESSELIRGTLLSWGMLLLPFFCQFLSIFADTISIFAYLDMRKSWFAFGLLFAAMTVSCLNFKYAHAFYHRPKKKDTCNHLGGDKFICKEMDGAYKIIGFTARCNAPGCDGVVGMENAPPREKHGHKYVGTCSNAPREHTFAITRDLKGYFRIFDWRPLEKDKPK